MKSLHFNSKSRTIGHFFTIVLVLLLLTAGMGFAIESSTPSDNEQPAEPIVITSDTLLTDTNGNSAEFSGNVKAVQGDTVITSEKLKIFFKNKKSGKSNADETAMEKIIATGKVKIKFDNRVAVTQKAVYITSEKLLVLTGPDSTVTSEGNSISGEKITLNRADGRVRVEGGTKNRVKAIILPGKEGLN